MNAAQDAEHPAEGEGKRALEAEDYRPTLSVSEQPYQTQKMKKSRRLTSARNILVLGMVNHGELLLLLFIPLSAFCLSFLHILSLPCSPPPLVSPLFFPLASPLISPSSRPPTPVDAPLFFPTSSTLISPSPYPVSSFSPSCLSPVLDPLLTLPPPLR